MDCHNNNCHILYKKPNVITYVKQNGYIWRITNFDRLYNKND